MKLNYRINILLIIFSILYIASSCDIIEKERIIFPQLTSTILNGISFLSSLIVIYFYKLGVKIINEIGSSRLLFLAFYLSCSFFFISYCYVMILSTDKIITYLRY